MFDSLVGQKVVPVVGRNDLRTTLRELQWDVTHPREVTRVDAEHIYCGNTRFYIWELLSREEVGDILHFQESIERITEEYMQASDEVSEETREEELKVEEGNFAGYVNEVMGRIRRGVKPEEVYTN